LYLAYFDESGDDGYPQTSSTIFVLSSLYFHHSVWKDNYNRIHELRKFLKTNYGLPVKQEFHTREFILDKNPYHGLYSTSARKEILVWFCKTLASLNLKAINVAIFKNKINRPAYDILKNALTYNIQRIENDLNYLRGDSKFLIITDEGRVSKMTTTTRMIQKINYIPSKFNVSPYRKEIQNLIEDPLPKKSSESLFIQMADLMCFAISIYAKRQVCHPVEDWNKRLREVLNYGDEIMLLEILKPVLNLKASPSNPYSVVCYPK
jgi:hypothetical protein